MPTLTWPEIRNRAVAFACDWKDETSERAEELGEGRILSVDTDLNAIRWKRNRRFNNLLLAN